MKSLFAAILVVTSATATYAEELKQSSVRGLLVIELPNGKHAGAASQMNATLVPRQNEIEFMRFNQEVGRMMAGSINEVQKFLSVRHPDKDNTKVMIELSFADRHSPKDGPSAAVACALLGDSLLTGHKIDPKFAVTGDMTATGVVQPIGGVSAKIRGASNRGDSEIVAIPIKNESAIEDLYITDGIEKLYKIQIFTIATFDDAKKIAALDRDLKITKAIEDFKMIQMALTKNESYIKNPKVRAKLRDIYAAAPNCVSAKILLLDSLGNGPRRLSPGGSIDAIEVSSSIIGNALSDGSYKNAAGNNDILFKSLSNLQRIRTKLDKRTIEYCDTVLDVGQWIKLHRNDKIISNGDVAQVKALVEKLQQEENKIRNNSKFMEELME